MVDKPTITVKRGDDFSLDLTVKDTNNDTAIAAKAALDAALVAYDEAVAADPQVPDDITATAAAVVTAQEAYDESVIVDITAWTIESQLAWCGKFISDFVVTITDGPLGKFAITAAKEVTALWKTRVYEADIEFNYSLFGRKTSQTLYIEVVRDITNAG